MKKFAEDISCRDYFSELKLPFRFYLNELYNYRVTPYRIRNSVNYNILTVHFERILFERFLKNVPPVIKQTNK